MTNDDQIIILWRVDRLFNMDKLNGVISLLQNRRIAHFIFNRLTTTLTDMNHFKRLFAHVPDTQSLKTLTATQGSSPNQHKSARESAINHVITY